MSRYVISDHHFGHSRIIGYTDRPFSSVGEMNQTLLNRHYETVGEQDTLVHLGDVAMDMQTGDETIEFFERLGGDVLVRGNHDVGLDADRAPFPVLDACILSHGEREFYCTHRPEDVPDDWDGWAIHGHMHNNDTDTYPFVAADTRRVNVSSELLNFRPLALDTLAGILDACPDDSRIRDVDTARKELG
ncbi:metallophosphoesterase [Halomicroarcula sp. GCM10025817]|uniref:metallophosphoesterase n=1 Tax=Haloarcula TaxID=2237 RepID=UPI0023E85726|nr:metallophosphoesterase [Halomicroarcula sp. SYNS111]